MSEDHTAELTGPKRLWDEYKLIQDKIDKIGDFQFKFKGWSATLLGALLYGGFKTSNIGTAVLCGVVVAAIFHVSEARQRWLSKRLGRRATAIENAFRSFPPIADSDKWQDVQRQNPAMRFAPAIGRTMADQFPERWCRRNAITRFIGRLVMRSIDVFYCAQYLLLASLFGGYLVSTRVTRLTTADDPAPRYRISAFGHEIIIYKQSK